MVAEVDRRYQEGNHLLASDLDMLTSKVDGRWGIKVCVGVYSDIVSTINFPHRLLS